MTEIDILYNIQLLLSVILIIGVGTLLTLLIIKLIKWIRKNV